MTELPQRIYRLFRRELGPAQPVRSAIIALIIAAIVVTAFAVVQVGRRHEVVRLGYALSKASERLRVAEEQNRRLELERATLTAPERIRALALGLGMGPTPPDQIRVVHAPQAARLDDTPTPPPEVVR